MNSSRPLRIGAVLFENFEILDFFGPLEMFALLKEDAVITVIAEKAGVVQSSGGPSAHADMAMAAAHSFDVLLIPGGIGTRKEMLNEPFMRELVRLAETSALVMTVCTGSYLLAKTGLLDGRKATTNKKVFRMVADAVPAVDWISHARWVEDGKYLTSSGISAGIDLSLAVIGKRFSKERALEIADHAEYEWHQDSSWDPFADINGL